MQEQQTLTRVSKGDLVRFKTGSGSTFFYTHRGWEGQLAIVLGKGANPGCIRLRRLSDGVETECYATRVEKLEEQDDAETRAQV